MSVQPKNQRLDSSLHSNEIKALPPKPLTAEQEEKVKGGLASSEARIGDGLETN